MGLILGTMIVLNLSPIGLWAYLRYRYPNDADRLDAALIKHGNSLQPANNTRSYHLDYVFGPNHANGGRVEYHYEYVYRKEK